jgi:hypothetical protein
MCQAIVMDGPQGGRLVVIEDQRIVDWKRFRMTSELRQYAGETLKARKRAGWVPSALEFDTDLAAPHDSPGADHFDNI